MANYDVGDVARVAVEFTDVLTGAFVDPSLVKAKVRTPAGVITTFTHPTSEIIKDAVGKYRIDVLLDRQGEWRVRWEGRTTNRAAEEVALLVDISEFYTQPGVEKPDGPS